MPTETDRGYFAQWLGSKLVTVGVVICFGLLVFTLMEYQKQPTSVTSAPAPTFSALESRKTIQASQVPLRVSKSCQHWIEGPGCEIWRVKITDIADDVKLLAVHTNRGNCKIVEFGGLEPVFLPHTLRFGMSIEVLTQLCEPIEIEVATDQGSFTFGFAS